MKANQFTVFKEDNDALIFELLIGAVFALVVGYTAMNIGIYITGTVASSLIDTYPVAVDRTPLQNISINNLGNLSTSFGTNNQMVSTAYMITIITLPLMAVLVIKKMI